MTFVLDAGVLLCLLFEEPGHMRARELFLSGERLVMHAVNEIEVLYQLRRRGEVVFTRGRDALDRLPIDVVRDVGQDLAARVVELKATQAPISLADCFAVALAMDIGAMLVTTDRAELEKVAASGACTVEFLR